MSTEERTSMEARWRLGDGNVCFRCLQEFDWLAMVAAENATIGRCHAVVEAPPEARHLTRLRRCRTEGRLCFDCALRIEPLMCFEHVDTVLVDGRVAVWTTGT